jgi:hypothetical protein
MARTVVVLRRAVWRRGVSSARSTVDRSFASDSGFSMKSTAPRRVASTAVSTVP